MIDIEKFICSLLADHPEGVTVRRDIHKALKDQGLEYKDGKIVNAEPRFGDGDVLYCKNGSIEYIVMSKGENEHGNIDSYFRYNSLDGFGVDIPSVLSTKYDNITLANKEQREFLFKKMHDAGYEWDAEHKQLKKIEPKEKPTEFEKGVKATLEQMQGFPVTDESVALYAAQLLLVAKKQLREEFDKQLELAYKNADEVQYGRGYRKAVEDARKWVAFVAGNDDVWIESFNRTMEKRLKEYGNKR